MKLEAFSSYKIDYSDTRRTAKGVAMKLEIDLDIPECLLDEAVEKAIRVDAILRLFEARKIPSGHATRLLALTRPEFQQLAQKRGISLHDYTFDGWKDDSATIEKLWPEIERNLREPCARGIE